MPKYGFKKSYAQPTPNKMRQAFDIPAMSEQDTIDYPDLASAWAGREIELPLEAAATKSVRPMNWLERKTVGSGAKGLTWPWGTIAINTDEPQDYSDTLAHELIHVGQNSLGGLLKNAYSNVTKGYQDQPREVEAFEYGASRPVRSRDIELFPEEPELTELDVKNMYDRMRK